MKAMLRFRFFPSSACIISLTFDTEGLYQNLSRGFHTSGNFSPDQHRVKTEHIS
jgi:hypothetical protein